jgi:hypothetical protein
MKKIIQLFLLVLISTSIKSQVTVNGGPTLTYTSLNTAFAAINAGTHFGAITIDITGNTVEGVTGYAPTPLLASGQSLANYSSIVIRPTVQATITGAPASGRGVIELDGADNVTIDGDIAAGPVNRDLTFHNNNAITITLTADIRLIGRTTGGLGATNITIQNCIIRGNTEGNDGVSGSTVNSSFGIYAGATTANLSTTGLGDNYDNLTIKNNEFNKSYTALYIRANTATPADNCLISDNIVGSNTAGQTITFAGIDLSGVVTSTVLLNQVFNFTPNTTISPYAIQVGGTASNSVTISRNKVYAIKSLNTSSGYGAYGINISGGTNHLLVNNVIYDISGVNYSSTSQTFNGFGIRLASGTGHKVYYNSVNLFGLINLSTASASSIGSAAFLVTSTAVTGIDVRNNIFCNTQTSTLTTVTTRKFMAVWFPTSYNFVNAILNNNAYNVLNDGDHFVGKIGLTNNVTEASNLAAWQAFSQVNNATNDVNSVPVVNAAAPFTSNTNLTIPANTNYGGESGAVPIASLGTNIDYNANVRPLAGSNPNLNPDMGAYEFDGINGFPTDAGINNLVSPAATGCYGANENVIVSIKNYGAASISNIPVTLTVNGPINQTLTGTYAGVIAPSATFNYTLGTINMTAAGTYTFKSWTSLSGDLQLANDTLANITRTVVALAALPQFVGFTGYTGANLPTFFPDWREGAGATVPTGTTSSWTSQTNLNSAGNVNARVLLSATAANEWIVGPRVLATANTNISFDAALTDNTTSPFNSDVMGSDDKVRVMVSTDCGVSYTPVFTISATNSLSTTFSNFNVSLSSYAGQEIIVAFLAQDGPIDDIESYYFHLENINLYNASATDAGIPAITSPSTGCFGNAEPVIVTVKNFGIASISNFPVTTIVSGAVNQTLTGTYTGVLAPSASAGFTLGTVNMSTAGTYTFKAYTSLTGDTNIYNDTTIVQKTSVAVSSIPQSVNFTGFTGANLPSFFPDWREAQGLTTAGTGTTSNWTSFTGLNGPTNVTARVQLLSATRNEWIVGPRVTATNSTVISFDAAVTDLSAVPGPSVMGSDDMVRVMVSTDCGVTYVPIFTVSATNSLATTFTNFNLNLSAYAGQDIMVAFFATDGPVDDAESYYFHLDNINLYNNVAADGGVSAILSPSANACLSATEQIVVTVNNFGLNAISNFPVTAIISGPVNTTITTTYTGVLTPSTNATFTIGTANMNLSGTYTVNAFTGVPGDPNTFNDGVIGTFTQSPSFAITGGNLICSSGSQTLNIIGAAATYTWFNSSNSSSVVVSPTVTTTYSATGTGTNNCQVSAFFTVGVVNPTISGMGAVVCSSTSVGTLTANAFAPVSWYATPTSTAVLATGNTFTASAPVTTTYYAEAKSTFNGSLQTLFSGGNSCGGGNMFDLTPTNGAIALDSLDVNTTVAAASSLTVMIFYKTGTYLGNETTPAAWTAWDTIVVTSAGSGNPTRVVFGNGPITIPNSQLTGIFVNYSASYTNGTNLYSNSDIAVQMGAGLCGQFSGVNAGRMFNGNLYYTKPGCTSPKIPVTLTVNPTPTVSINASPSNVICSGNTVTLTASGADTYTWSTSATSTVINVTPSTNTTYSVNAGSIGCSGTYTANIMITVNSNPTVNITASSMSICTGNSVTLNASGAVLYNWNTSATTQSIVETPTLSTSYSVVGTAANNCTSSAQVNITVNAKPTVSLSAASNTACLNGGLVALTGSPSGGVYTGPNVSGNNLNPSATGTFNPVYTYTDSSTGCSNSATTSVIVSICTDIISRSVNNTALKVYPNPNSGVFTIETGNSLNKTLTLTDVAGRIVHQETTEGGIIQMNISELANGIYHLRIASENGIDIIKVIKQ